MESKRISIVELDVKELIAHLNALMADEWLSYYHYWVSSRVIRGPLRGALIKELLEHADDELKHANMLASRIMELGGSPLLSPELWMKESRCGYDAPEDSSSESIIRQVINGEQCAIVEYNKLIEKNHQADSLTHHMLVSILADEVRHEMEFQDFLDDLKQIR